MAILKFKDENGNFVDIPVIEGQDGLSAYEIWLQQGNEGTETDYLNSLKGDKGERGPAGKNGTNGIDGKTPVKGTDYYTEVDKQEMVNLVLNALPSAEGVEF